MAKRPIKDNESDFELEDEGAPKGAKKSTLDPQLALLWDIVNEAVTNHDYGALDRLQGMSPQHRIEGFKFAALWAGGDTVFEMKATEGFVAEVEALKTGKRKAYQNALNLVGGQWGPLFGDRCWRELEEIMAARREAKLKEMAEALRQAEAAPSVPEVAQNVAAPPVLAA